MALTTVPFVLYLGRASAFFLPSRLVHALSVNTRLPRTIMTRARVVSLFVASYRSISSRVSVSLAFSPNEMQRFEGF